jgi:hypothetical protein
MTWGAVSYRLPQEASSTFRSGGDGRSAAVYPVPSAAVNAAGRGAPEVENPPEGIFRGFSGRILLPGSRSDVTKRAVSIERDGAK